MRVHGLKITVTVERDPDAGSQGPAREDESSKISKGLGPGKPWLVIDEETGSDLKPPTPEEAATLKHLASQLTSSKARYTPQERVKRAFVLGQKHALELEQCQVLTHPGSCDLQNTCWAHPSLDPAKTCWTNCKRKQRDLQQKVPRGSLIGFPTMKEAEAYFLGFGADCFLNLRL